MHWNLTSEWSGVPCFFEADGHGFNLSADAFEARKATHWQLNVANSFFRNYFGESPLVEPQAWGPLKIAFLAPLALDI